MSAEGLPKYVEELLNQIATENGFRDFIVRVNNDSKPGDGFASELFSVVIAENGSNKMLNLVCKVAPQNANHREEFSADVLFKHEARFYTKFMPKFAKFQEEKGVPKDDQFRSYPKCYTALIDDENERYVIILEDLRPNFKMWNKAKISPIENVRLAMRELGKFHGLSIAMKDQRPQEFVIFKEAKAALKILLRKEDMQAIFFAAYDRAFNSLKDEDHKIIMQHIKINFLAVLDDCLDNDAPFGVLSHGDCWNNNFLYRFNEDDIAVDVRFLDWQMVQYVSPAIDVLHYIFPSTDKAFRDKEYDNMLICYYDSLAKTVELLGSNPNELFSFENLKDDLKRYGNHALFWAPMVIQVAQADSNEISKLDEMFDESADVEKKPDLITGLSAKGQSEYDRRINEVFEDIVKLGYYRKMH